jgi:hypothetical protein
VADYFFPWVADNPDGGRYFGNIGQPNQLASLVMGSFLCGLYLEYRGKISGFMLILLAVTFGLSLSLAGSKTAITSLILVMLLFVFYKEIKYFVFSFLCGLSFFVFSFLIADKVRDYSASDVSTGRFTMWEMLINSVLHKPWVGYGFNSVAIANFEVVDNFPLNWHRFTAHSHNIFLDFFVWFGIPLGILFSIFFLYIFWQHFFMQKSTKKRLIAFTVIPLLVHSMFEFPLHYAYFLIPISFIIGSCWEGRNLSREIYFNQFLIIYCLFFGLFIVKEYLFLEKSLTEQRFYANNFSNSKEQTILAYQFLDLPTMQLNFLIKKEITKNDYVKMINIIKNYPTYRNFYLICNYFIENNEYDKFLIFYNKALALLSKEEAENFKDSFERRIQIRRATPVDSMNEGGVLRAVDQQFSVHSQR